MALNGVEKAVKRIHPKDKYKREAQFYGDKGPEYTLLLDCFERLGGDLKDKTALEMFAGHGSFRTVDIIVRFGEFEGWDIHLHKLSELFKKFPWVYYRVGEATELAKEQLGSGKLYDLISLDSQLRCYGEKFCEHFEILKLATKLLKPNGALLLNMATRTMSGEAKHQRQRKKFYMKSDGDLSVDALLDFYDEYFFLCGKKIVHTKVEPHGWIKGYYMVLFMLEDI